MAVFAMEAASIISERSLEISFASALSTVSSSGVNVNAGKPCVTWCIHGRPYFSVGEKISVPYGIYSTSPTHMQSKSSY